MKNILTVFLIVSLVFSLSCYKDEWNPDCLDLRMLSKYHNNYANLNRDVTTFYLLIKEKKWNDAYNYQTNDFMNNVGVTQYCKTMNRDASRWSFKNYKIKQAMIAHDNPNKVRLIISFFDNKGENTSIVWWKKEKDGWKCETIGPNVFSYSVIPMGSNADSPYP